MKERSADPGDISEKFAAVWEEISRAESILADMSANTTESLDRLQKEVNKMPGKWELRLWVLILIAIIVVLELFVRG